MLNRMAEWLVQYSADLPVVIDHFSWWEDRWGRIDRTQLLERYQGLCDRYGQTRIDELVRQRAIANHTAHLLIGEPSFHIAYFDRKLVSMMKNRGV